MYGHLGRGKIENRAPESVLVFPLEAKKCDLTLTCPILCHICFAVDTYHRAFTWSQLKKTKALAPPTIVHLAALCPTLLAASSGATGRA